MHKEQTQTPTYLDPVRIVVEEEDTRTCHLLRFHHRLQISQQVHVLWHVCRKYLARQRLFHEGRRPKGRKNKTKLPRDREIILSPKRKRETLNSTDMWKWGALFLLALKFSQSPEKHIQHRNLKYLATTFKINTPSYFLCLFWTREPYCT